MCMRVCVCVLGGLGVLRGYVVAGRSASQLEEMLKGVKGWSRYTTPPILSRMDHHEPNEADEVGS